MMSFIATTTSRKQDCRIDSTKWHRDNHSSSRVTDATELLWSPLCKYWHLWNPCPHFYCHSVVSGKVATPSFAALLSTGPLAHGFSTGGANPSDDEPTRSQLQRA
eukprot:5709245-Amphidinium_carterae.1